MKSKTPNTHLDVISEAYFFQYWASKRLPISVEKQDILDFFKPYITTIPKTVLGEYYWQIFDNSEPLPKVISVGGSVEAMTSFSPSALLEIEYQAFFRVFHPDDLPKLFSMVAKAYQMLFEMDEKKREQTNICIYARIQNAEKVYQWNSLQYPALYFDEKGQFLFGMALYTNVHHLMKPNASPMMTVLDSSNLNYQIFTCENADHLSEETKMYPKVTPREKEVLALMSQGKASKEIAHQLGISKFTVDNHRVRLLRKFNASSSTELIFKAITID
jgi:DNA-binding CsgD family transcriptional regulator